VSEITIKTPLQYLDRAMAGLRDLGLVREIGITLSSSDTGSFGMNTPGYVALDDLHVVPEPGSVALLGVGLLGLGLSHAIRRGVSDRPRVVANRA